MADLSDPKIADPRLGTVIDGRYRLDERIAAGGMGVVYKAERLGIGKVVAIKFLHETFAVLPDLVKRFEREAQTMSRLSHPNIASVIDHGVVGGAPYLVMEFHHGRSLGDILTGGPIPPRRAVAITRQILSGMRHAHDLGIVHRDLKPDNIMLLSGVDSDFVKILDFGLAKLVRGDGEDSTQLTNAGFALGTPGYMSPEQAQGGKLDHRTDIYSVGVMLFEMLVGHKPFRAESPIVLLRMQMDDPPPHPRKAAPLAGISVELEKVVLRALEKPPSKRYQSAGDFAAALEGTPEGSVSEVSMPIQASLGRSDPALEPTVHADSGPTSDSAFPVTPSMLTGQTEEAPSIPEFERRETRVERPRTPPLPQQVIVVHRSSVLAKLLLLAVVAAGGVALGWAKMHPKSAERIKEQFKEAKREVMGSDRPKTTQTSDRKTEPSPTDVAVAGSKNPPDTAAVPHAPDAGAALAEHPTAQAPDAAVAEEDDDSDESPPQATDTPGARQEQQAQAQVEEQQHMKPEAPPEVLGLKIEKPTARRAAQLLNEGKVEEAIKTLYLVRRREPRNPAVPLLLGHAYFRKVWRTDGLREYWTALGLRSSLKWDKQLQKNAVIALDDPTYRAARTVIRKRIGTAALGELRTAARSAKNPNVKRRAAKLAAQLAPARHRRR